jgi:formate-dependent nitrite reductase membrane component NrfD
LVLAGLRLTRVLRTTLVCLGLLLPRVRTNLLRSRLRRTGVLRTSLVRPNMLRTRVLLAGVLRTTLV